MPLLDSLTNFATQYGPSIISAYSQIAGGKGMGGGAAGFMPGGGSPMGLAAPRTRMPGTRKKRRGLSASDIRGAQKVARLVSHFGYKPKIRARKRGR